MSDFKKYFNENVKDEENTTSGSFATNNPKEIKILQNAWIKFNKAHEEINDALDDIAKSARDQKRMDIVDYRYKYLKVPSEMVVESSFMAFGRILQK